MVAVTYHVLALTKLRMYGAGGNQPFARTQRSG
jgi:hypothetical protein